LSSDSVSRVDLRRLDRVPRALTGLDLRGIALRGGHRQRGERLASLAVAHGNDVPALAVAAAGRVARMVQDVDEHPIGQRVVGEVARGERRPHDVVELHEASCGGVRAAGARTIAPMRAPVTPG
jgi:hypothetical protein